MEIFTDTPPYIDPAFLIGFGMAFFIIVLSWMLSSAFGDPLIGLIGSGTGIFWMALWRTMFIGDMVLPTMVNVVRGVSIVAVVAIAVILAVITFRLIVSR